MMIGCCHCGSESTPSVPSESNPPSDSTPPSESGSNGSASASSSAGPVGCLSCTGAVAASIYRFRWIHKACTTGPGDPCCYLYESNEYILHWNPTYIYGPGGCVWTTIEEAGNLVAGVCNNWANHKRAMMYISGGFVQVHIIVGSAGTAVSRFKFRKSYTPTLNCLASHTLTEFSFIPPAPPSNVGTLAPL